MANGGVHQYARIATHLRGRREVLALPLLGYELGESLPATGADAIGAVVHGALDAADGEPFVLLGHSAGGLLAYCAAAALRDNDASLRGVVMLDTFFTSGGRQPAAGAASDAQPADDLVLPALFDAVFRTEKNFGGFNSARLSAMAHWLTLWPEIEIGQVDVPVLFVQCTEPLDGVPSESDGWRSTPVDSSHTVRPLAANHFSMLEDHAEDTARLVEEWLVAGG
jgi:thioesterase domain-containing protein